MKKLLLTALLTILCLCFAACGGEEDIVYNPDADNPEVTDTEWATEIWNDAIDKLVADGYATKSDEDGILLQCMDSGMIDLHPGEKVLDASSFDVDGKVIWGSADVYRSENPYLYVDKVSDSKLEENPDLPAYTSPNAPSTMSADVFAKSRSRCKYLMLVVGLCYNIEKDYYFGPVDRRDVSTHVFVIDAVDREVVHINFINSDVPGMSVTSPFGEVYEDAARNYMTGLCDK